MGILSHDFDIHMIIGEASEEYNGILLDIFNR